MSLNSSSVQIVLPYAEALLALSRSLQAVDTTATHLSLILESLERSEKLENFLNNPLFAAKVKKSVLNELFANQVNPHVLHFLYVLVDRRRIVLLKSVIQHYFDLADKLRLVTVVEVITALPLNDLQKEAVQKKLKHMTASNEVRLIEQVDSDLIGGLIVKIGSKVIDMSISGQLSQISSYLNRSPRT